jgi:tetratricopeptide (TPR) repeat protein
MFCFVRCFRVLVAFVVAVVSTSVCRADEPKAGPLTFPKIHRGDSWAIAAPGSWESDPAIRPPMALKLRGEGRKGFPGLDGTLGQLRITLTITQFDSKAGPIPFIADAWKKNLAKNKAQRLEGEIQEDNIKIAGDVDAIRLWLTKTSLDKARWTYYRALIAADDERRVIVVVATVEFGWASREYIDDLKLMPLVEATVATLTLNDAGVDRRPLEESYRGFDWRATRAEHITLAANRMARGGHLTRANELYKEAIDVCDNLPAARQRLASLHLTARDPAFVRPEFAVKLAEKAVEQTGHLDIKSLDTLAMGYTKLRQRAKAAEVFKKALDANPASKVFLQRLSLYQ